MKVERIEGQTDAVCREKLDQALKSDVVRLLVTVGPTGSKAEQLHAAMEANAATEGGGWRDDQKYAWLPDVSLLSEDERKRWFGGVWGNPTDHFVMLDKGPVDKPFLQNGPVHKLIRSDGRVRFNNLRNLFEGFAFSRVRL